MEECWHLPARAILRMITDEVGWPRSLGIWHILVLFRQSGRSILPSSGIGLEGLTKNMALSDLH